MKNATKIVSVVAAIVLPILVQAAEQAPKLKPKKKKQLSQDLIEAVKRGNTVYAASLLEQNADPNTIINNTCKDSLLLYALDSEDAPQHSEQYRCTPMVRLLIEYKADVNYKNEWGDRPATMALFCRVQYTRKLLVERGAK